MRRRIVLAAGVAAACACAIAFAAVQTVLPSGWRLSPPPAALAKTGTMPQGIALSPDGTMVAVLESGETPAALRILDAHTLRQRTTIALPGAFGTPVWRDGSHVLLAGANADAVLTADLQTRTVTAGSIAKGTWPAALAVRGSLIAIANDASGTIGLGGTRIPVGAHPSAIVFSRDGKTVYVAVRGENAVRAIDAAAKRVTASIPVGLHPGALTLSADGSILYVAESDDDTVGEISTRTNTLLHHVPVGLNAHGISGVGASPNALLEHDGTLFVSLGAENAIALVQHDRVVRRVPAGWYPTGLAIGTDGTLYVADGKGEGAPANPQFNPFKHNSRGYVAATTVGSVRAIPQRVYASDAQTQNVIANAEPQWSIPAQTVLRKGGPIQHVIYIIKENRSYDQVLGDLRGANGDPQLTSFGNAITPNLHALARRFGIFDNAYANAQVSADGHNWTDAGFANDYVERMWPVIYGGRRDEYDMQNGTAPDVPHNGYLWDAAKRAHITFRDYGEDVDRAPNSPVPLSINTFPGLTGRFDPHYIGWDLTYSDADRYAEWRKEFRNFVASKSLPAFEMVYLPNDHTSGTKPGALTPQAYLAQNDWAVGRLVEDVSRSPYWKSTAIFILEDDAQNGPDHVSDQRSTFYIASPYAKRGVYHEHYSTVSFVRTMELILGLPPLSAYDTVARPLYDAFGTSAANGGPFIAVKPGIDLRARNTKAAYGAAVSAKLDFSKPDAADSRVLNDVIAHAAKPQ